MHDTGRSKRLTNLLETTREMLKKAGSGDWESVARLQGRQNRLAREIFEVSMAASETCEIAATIMEVLRTNARTLELFDCERKTCIAELHSCFNRRQALKAYSSNS
jgi:hypothetical protein